MSPGSIKLALDEVPFQPFTLHTSDGRKIGVHSREYAFLYPGGQTLLVSEPKSAQATEESDFLDHRIDVATVTKISEDTPDLS